MQSLSPWMENLGSQIGTEEIPGRRNNPVIINYFNYTNFQPGNDETAWCSACMNWAMAKSNMPRTNSAAALSWLNWGQPSGPVYGALVVYDFGGGHGHVATLAGINSDGRHIVLGGNQGIPGNVSAVPWGGAKNVSYRVPFGYRPDRALPKYFLSKKKSINFRSTR